MRDPKALPYTNDIISVVNVVGFGKCIESYVKALGDTAGGVSRLPCVCALHRFIKAIRPLLDQPVYVVVKEVQGSRICG
jgi:hypothetical protein